MCPSYCSSLALQTWLQDPTLAPGVQLLLLVQSNPPLCLTTTCFAPHPHSHLAEEQPSPSCLQLEAPRSVPREPVWVTKGTL